MSPVAAGLLSVRDIALLRAVDANRCQVSTSCEPVLLVDGRCCCDGGAAARLIDAGLIEPPPEGVAQSPAVLTAAGLRTVNDH